MWECIRERRHSRAMWCERPYKETAEDHLRVTPIRSGDAVTVERGLPKQVSYLDDTKRRVNLGGTTIENRP